MTSTAIADLPATSSYWTLGHSDLKGSSVLRAFARGAAMARVNLQRRAAIGDAKRASSNPSYFGAIDRRQLSMSRPWQPKFKGFVTSSGMGRLLERSLSNRYTW